MKKHKVDFLKKFEPAYKLTSTKLESTAGSEVNSPTRDQQILFDRAGNSQDWGSQQEMLRHRPLKVDVIYSYDKQPVRPSSGASRPASMSKKSLLPAPSQPGLKTLVLDLDETLVHSSFKKVRNADILQPIDIDGYIQTIYVNVRPFAEDFILQMSQYYEIIMFTASIQKYAQPIFNKLDPNRVCQGMLFREHCTIDAKTGYMVKDLTRLGRKIEDVIIIDNSTNSYHYQPENAMPSKTWIKDPQDYELRDMIPFLKKLSEVKDVRHFLQKVVDYTQGTKTPVFNKRKAGQLIKLMNGPEFTSEIIRLPSNNGKISQKDLRIEIQKAQETAAKIKNEKKNTESLKSVIYKPLLQPQKIQPSNVDNYGESRQSALQVSKTATVSRPVKSEMPSSKIQPSSRVPSSRIESKPIARVEPKTEKTSCRQLTKLEKQYQPLKIETQQKNVGRSMQTTPMNNAPTPINKNEFSTIQQESPDRKQQKPVVEFTELNDSDINEITSYYYQKYKTKKRRRSSLTRELKKIDGESNNKHELDQKRVEILQKYTGQTVLSPDISLIPVKIESPASNKKVSYTQQLMQKKKQQLKEHDENIIFKGYGKKQKNNREPSKDLKGVQIKVEQIDYVTNQNQYQSMIQKQSGQPQSMNLSFKTVLDHLQNPPKHLQAQQQSRNKCVRPATENSMHLSLKLEDITPTIKKPSIEPKLKKSFIQKNIEEVSKKRLSSRGSNKSSGRNTSRPKINSGRSQSALATQYNKRITQVNTQARQMASSHMSQASKQRVTAQYHSQIQLQNPKTKISVNLAKQKKEINNFFQSNQSSLENLQKQNKMLKEQLVQVTQKSQYLSQISQKQQYNTRESRFFNQPQDYK